MSPRFSDIPRGSRQKRGMSPFSAGVIALVVIALATYFAFSKSNPFAGPFELEGVFDRTNTLAPRSPVRIAGVNVGKVKSVEPIGDGLARVKMEITDAGLPIHRDAELSIRSRLFLEGNYFVELRPGTPGAPELESGAVIGPDRTAAPVQFNELLTALQSETREDLRTFLREYSSSLRGSGARGFNQAIRHWKEAYRKTSQVSDATRGTRAHDLTRLLRGQGRVFAALSRDERALADLVTGLNRTFAGFASQEDNLRAAIPELRDVLREGRPTLAALDRALPSVRAFARDALPAAREASPMLDAQLPFVRQARRLMSRAELGGLAPRLRATLPALVRLNSRTPATLEQNRALASCQNRVLLPFAKTPIPDPDFEWHSGEPFFEESSRSFVGLAGESRLADANSPYFHTLGGGGPTTIVQSGDSLLEPLFGQTLLPLEGVRPAKPAKQPVFRPGEPCELQEPPDLNAAGSTGDQQVTPNAAVRRTEAQQRARDAAFEALRKFQRRSLKGLPALDPLVDALPSERRKAQP